eukprot:gb/GECG01003302.1/.p1 GENE.gb/GECG01003302.1/~~gb/GECG01003302.1/.p1  ORF type:complete len:250 (+),score=56.27 gb/GECG01003302.1/:1-750(+)
MNGSQHRSLEDIDKDIEELQRLIGSCSRDKVTQLLKDDLNKLQRERGNAVQVQKQIDEVSKPKPAAVSTESATGGNSSGSGDAKAASSGKYFQAVTRFGWGQSDKFVSVYVSEDMEGVGSLYEHDDQAVQCEFTSNSFDLKVYGLKGRNYRLYRENLENEIDPESSKFKVKQDRVTVMLKKKDSLDHWTELVSKRKKPNISKEDPSGGIMDMMKQMYEEGDDNMKRTIAEAWEKSQKAQMQGKSPMDDI